MRISTVAFNQQTIDLINDKTAQLAITQAQLSSGLRVNSPADDPVASVHILQINQAISQVAQYGRNADAANARLSNEDQTLSNVTDVLQRIRDLTVQANSGSQDATSRAAIATEIDQDMNQLMDLANTRDSNGEYLFSGLKTQLQPFARRFLAGHLHQSTAHPKSLHLHQYHRRERHVRRGHSRPKLCSSTDGRTD